MTILELPQGYYRDLSGMPKAEAIAMFTKDAVAFLLKHPQCAPYHRPCWLERDAQQSVPSAAWSAAGNNSVAQ